MKKTEQTLRYLQEYFGDGVKINKWQQEAEKKLSLSLVSSFDYYSLRLLGTGALLLYPRAKENISTYIDKLRLVEQKTGIPAVLAVGEPSAYVVKKLLAEKTAFISADKQMSIPFLALRLKNCGNKDKIIADKKSKFTPIEQLVFLFCLYSEDNKFEICQMTQELGISQASAARAMERLRHENLVDSVSAGKTGRKKFFSIEDKKTYFQIGREFLADQVKETVYVSTLPDKTDMKKTGLTALSELTMLADQGQRHYAVYMKSAPEFPDSAFNREREGDGTFYKIDLLRYDPNLLADGGYTDPITMIMAVNESDERIEMEKDRLLEGFEWYTA